MKIKIAAKPEPKPAAAPRTVDITPTWEGVLPLLLAAHESGTFDGRRESDIELRRMAKLADAAVADAKAKAEPAADRDAALIAILKAADIRSEEGEPMTDFINQHRDAYDFASVARWTLKSMLEAAYEAGRASKGE